MGTATESGYWVRSVSPSSEWSAPCIRVSHMVTKWDPADPPGSWTGMLNFMWAKDICHCPFWCCVMRTTSSPLLMTWDHLRTSLHLHIRVWSQTPLDICSGCTPHKEPHLRAYWAPGRCLISWKNVCICIIMMLSPHISATYISYNDLTADGSRVYSSNKFSIMQ